MRKQKNYSFKKMHSFKGAGIVCFAAALALFMAAFMIMSHHLAYAATKKEKKKEGTTYYRYTVELGNKIEPSTLFIGTYLIYMKSLTDENYSDALQSRKTYKQGNVYYKTELDDDSWHDVINAVRISTIMPGAKRIDEDSMKNLLITVVIGPDGVPRDPEDQSKKNPFDEPDPYGLANLPELEPLVVAYEESQYKTKSELYTQDRLKYFFGHCKSDDEPIELTDPAMAMPIYGWVKTNRQSKGEKSLELIYDYVEERMRLSPPSGEGLSFSPDEINAAQRIMMHWSDTRDEYTASMDEAVKNIWEIYLDYKEKDKNAESDALYTVTGNLDAERRARVFYNLTASETHHGGVGPILSSLLSSMVKSGQSKIGRYFPYMKGGEDNFTPMTNVTQALDSSVTNCRQSYQKYLSEGLNKKNTAISQYSNDVKADLIQKKKGDEGIDPIVQSLVDVKNVESEANVKERKDREISLIKDYLVPMQNKILSDFLTRGVPGTYSSSLSEAEKKALLDPMEDEARESVQEQEKYDEWLLARLEKEEDQKSFLTNQITWVEGQQKKIPQDDNLGHSEIVRKEYEDWLKKKRDGATDGKTVDDGGDDGTDGSGLEPNSGNNQLSPEELYEYFKEEERKALERDDIKTAKECEEMVRRLEAELKITGKKSDNNNNKGSGGNGSGNGGGSKKKGDGSGNGSGKKGNGDKKRAYEPSNWKNGLPKTGIKEKNKQNDTQGEGTDNLSGGNDGSGKGKDGSDMGDGSGKDKDGSDKGDGSGKDKDGSDKGDGSGKDKDGSDKGDGSGKDKDGSGNGSGNDNGSGNGNGSDKTTKEAAKEAADALRKDRGETDSSSVNGRKLSDDEVLSALEELLGKPFDELSPDMKGAAVVALNEFGMTYNDEGVLNLARRLLDQIMGERNPLVYLKFEADPVGEYVSFGAIDKARIYSGLRLVDEEKEGVEVLSTINGSTEYPFHSDELAGSQTDSYIRGSLVEEYSYLDENVAEEKISLRAEYISEKDYAVLVTKKMEPVVRKIVRKLEELAGYATSS